MQIGKLSWVLTVLLATPSTVATVATHATTTCASFTTQATATHHDGNGNGFYVSPWFRSAHCDLISVQATDTVDLFDDPAFPRAIIGLQFQATGNSDEFNIIPMKSAAWTVVDENAVPPGVSVRLISETKITSIVVEN